MDFSGLSIIFFTSIIGGSFGTLVGGTSLITIPVLIFLGLPPHTAIGTVGILIIVIAQPRLGLEKRERVIQGRTYGTGIFITFLIGIYGGFYGAMAGAFLLYVLLFVFEQTFLEGPATLTITSLLMTTMAAVVFASKGAINYPMAAAMFL